MSFEDKQNDSYDAPKKSGRSWFAFCGIGCLILLLLCGVGAVITYFMAGDFIKSMIDIGRLHGESIQLAIESEAIQEKLGQPISPDMFSMPTESQDGETRGIAYNIDLKGSKGTGQLIIEYQIEPGKTAKRTKFEVVVDGETINLMDSDEFQMPDIDDGKSDMDDAESPMDEEEVPMGVGG